jgi:hypothetical protein
MADLEKPCREWTGVRDAHGYGRRRLRGYRTRLVHRQVFSDAHGYLPPVVRHACDNPPCYELAHLLPGTHLDNVRDALDRGRIRKGEEHGMAKLTRVDVRAIRRLVSTGHGELEVATAFGVSRRAVNKIIKGETWRESA